MSRIAEKYEKVCKRLDWSVNYSEHDEKFVELEKYSPAGEDFIITVSRDKFVENLKKEAENFDADEYVEELIRYKIENTDEGLAGIPSLRVLIQDADDIQDMLHELAEELAKAEEQSA